MTARPPFLRAAMLRPGEIIVDNFAGGGGASLGMEWALGRSPDIAINHDAQAVAMHEANHPETKHYVEDVWEVDPVKACAGRPVGLAWFSPDCKHFSKAKGGKPVSKKIRGLAWIVVKWAKLVRPRVIMLENVEEFQTWGPLGEDNRPDKLKKGLTFQRWKGSLEKLGYKVEFRELIAADYGAPTTRKRLFLVARCDGLPIRWPQKTHDQHGRYGMPKWRAAAECIDWSIPCPSIFLQGDDAKALKVKRPLADNTLRRIARGLKKFVLDNPRPFIVPMQHQNAPRGVEDPLQTITTQGNKFNVVAPVVAKFRGDSPGSAADAPLPTITAGPAVNPAGAAHALGIVAPVLSAFYGDKGAVDSEGRCRDLRDPMPTQTGDPRFAVVAPILTEHANATNPRSWSADEPLRTQCAEVKGGHFAMVSAGIVPLTHQGGDRIESTDEPMKTITGAHRGERAVAAAYMVPRYGEREGQEPRAFSAERPMTTVVPTQNNASLVAAFLAKHNGGHEATGQDPAEAMHTIVARENKAVVQASFGVKLKGTCKDGQQLDLPLATVQAEGNHHAAASAFMVAYYGNEKDGGRFDEPARTLTAKERLGLVMVEGLWHQIVDIGMRMLVPIELYLCQGFPASYKTNVIFKGKPLPKDAQVRMCGNSVSPYPCCALVAENMVEMVEEVAA